MPQTNNRIKKITIFIIRKFLMNRFTLLFLSILLSFIASEIIFRIIIDGTINKTNIYSVSPTGNQYNFYQFDSLLGWSNKPGMSGYYQRAEFAYKISINRYGMRQKSISKSKTNNTYRIAVLGDSFVWGIGVDDEHRVTESLERFLPGTEILNFGVSGYAPIQYLLTLDFVMSFNPDLVIVLFCLSNDYQDNVFFEQYGYYKPYATIEENELKIKGYPLPNIRKFGIGTRNTFMNSRILGELINLLSKRFIGQKGLIGFSNELLYKDYDQLAEIEKELKLQAININELLIATMFRYLKNNGIRFIVADAPTKREYYDPITKQNGRFTSAEDELSHSCRKLHIPFIPNVNNLNELDFWEKDGHWNYEGNRKIALSLSSYLIKNGYIISHQKSR